MHHDNFPMLSRFWSPEQEFSSINWEQYTIYKKDCQSNIAICEPHIFKNSWNNTKFQKPYDALCTWKFTYFTVLETWHEQIHKNWFYSSCANPNSAACPMGQNNIICTWFFTRENNLLHITLRMEYPTTNVASSGEACFLLVADQP